MDNKKIIYFKEYLKQKKGKDSKSDASTELSAMIKTDIREQKEFLDWFFIHNSFNRFDFFLHSLFYENHEINKEKSLDAGFFIGFSKEHLDSISKSVCKALKKLERKYILIDARNKTLKQIGVELKCPNQLMVKQVFRTFEDILFTTNNVLVIKELSCLKLNRDKGGIIRFLVKIIDDAYFRGIKPKSDLIFIDYASFLEKICIEHQIEKYIRIGTTN